MTAKTHHYHTRTEWTGNLGVGTAHYTAYSRDHIHRAPGKADIPGSADPAYRGDPARWNPEELLLAAASACHKLWYLHHCADHRPCLQRRRRSRNERSRRPHDRHPPQTARYHQRRVRPGTCPRPAP